MTPMDLIKVIGDVDEDYVLSALETRDTHTKNKKRTTISRSLLIAALIALMLLLVGCCIIISMQLQQVVMDVPSVTDVWGEEQHIISLQGFEGSNSFEASQEWQTFLNSYDTDKKILYANNDFERPDAYFSYFCYSQEMVDKIAEICEKYDLEPLGKPWYYRQMDHLFEAVGIKTVFSDTAKALDSPFSGYCYNDGTFEMEGDIHLTGQWDYIVGYNLRSVQKTSFDDAFSSVGDLDTYEQWEYTMKDGTVVLLALQDEGRIIVDKEDCFVVITAFGTPEDIYAPIPHDRAFVEDFCEAFDFSYQTQRVDSDKAYALQCEEEPHDYATLIQYMLTVQSEEYPNLKYALIDINGDGQEELLLQSTGSPFLTEHPIEDNMFSLVIGMSDGELAYLMGGGFHYLCQENVIESLSPFDGEEKGRTFDFFDEGYGQEPVEAIYPMDNKLFHSVRGGDLVEITEEEAQVIISKYQRIDIDFEPASSFQG